ncbi:WRKY DNA-binding transcription factor 70-like [Syzygium oleosum]|uniref:WRKY DNA-binding transcription factor 70-like n=1 Tax=Syzygium oleosum TaxID=219896 RepID=UPI0011D28332|nr:WRKY DNA-binding transcription factor 70-like [Syzygium oleosum]
MGTDGPEGSPSSAVIQTKRVMEELLRGNSAAIQLQLLLKNSPGQNGPGGSGSSSPDELLETILRSFTESLSVLGSRCGSASAGHDRRVSPSSGESSESKRRLDLKDRRGSHKRRKTSQTWTKVSPTIEDNHAWRKYGQKVILNAKHPRSYFRCTHKYDQDCKAAKQVQRMEDNPQMFHITYIGVHTCRDIMKTPQMLITDPDTCVGESFPVKQEPREDAKSDLTNDNVSSMGFLFTGLESSDQPNDLASVSSARMGFDDTANGDPAVHTMCPFVDAADSHGLGMEFLRNSVSFDGDHFHFDESEF